MAAAGQAGQAGQAGLSGDRARQSLRGGACQRAVREALRTGTCEPFEREYVRKDGSRVPVLIGIAVLQREPPLFVSFVVDLSERKRLERSLLEREQLYWATFEQAAVGMARVAPTGEWLDVNQRLCEIVGYSREELMERTFQDIAYPDDLQADLAYVRQTLAGERDCYAMEKRYVRKDGTHIWGQLTVALVRDTAGDPEYFIAVVEDISPRKQAEAELRASEAKFRALAENIPQLVWMAHSDGHIFWYNQRWYDYTGTTPESQAGWGWQSVHDRAVLPQVLERWRHSLTTGEPFEMVFPLKRADGVFRHFLTRVQPIRDEHDQLVNWFGTNTDIEDHLRLEREREEARASELAAREVAQHIDEFFKTAAHDIRNPVGVVMSHLQLALRRFEKAQLMARGIDSTGHLDERLAAVHTNLAEASESADRLARLVTRLFDVARARAGVLHLECVPCDLTALVHEQVAAHRLVAPRRTIRVEVPEPLRPVCALADADRLGQVLANYLTNALKYSADDRPVTVGLDVTDGRAVVSVHDEGPGLPWDEQSQVWEPFHRAPGVEVQSLVGPAAVSLGLGLHICRVIVEQHPGGRACVESVVGRGSTFWFSLPLAAPGEASRHEAST